MTLMTEAGETREDLKLPDYPEVIILSVLEELLGSNSFYRRRSGLREGAARRVCEGNAAGMCY